jgi:hypothetical protein
VIVYAMENTSLSAVSPSPLSSSLSDILSDNEKKRVSAVNMGLSLGRVAALSSVWIPLSPARWNPHNPPRVRYLSLSLSSTEFSGRLFLEV